MVAFEAASVGRHPARLAATAVALSADVPPAPTGDVSGSIGSLGPATGDESNVGRDSDSGHEWGGHNNNNADDNDNDAPSSDNEEELPLQKRRKYPKNCKKNVRKVLILTHTHK